MKLIIKIIQEQHFIEGDRYHIYLCNSIDDTGTLMVMNIPASQYAEMFDALDDLKTKLENLGDEIEYVAVLEPDPNFETRQDAMKYIENKGV